VALTGLLGGTGVYIERGYEGTSYYYYWTADRPEAKKGYDSTGRASISPDRVTVTRTDGGTMKLSKLSKRNRQI